MASQSVICLLALFSWGALAEFDSEEICPQSCPDTGRRVCGSDGVTYQSRCHLQLAQCSQTRQRDLSEQHRGRCRPRDQKCLADLAYARRQRAAAGGDAAYLPACRPDGSYAPVQCHQVTGFCWCVDVQGRPVPNTSVRRTGTGKPRCGKRGKATIRRSSTRKRPPKRGCKRADRALFNNNLIDNFQTEWTRIHNTHGLTGAELDRSVLDWKFRDMDRNRDGLLDKAEYRDLKKLVKKVVKPKRCSKNFAHACDMDRDQQISRQEWSDCLTRDGMDDEKTGGPGGGGHDDPDDDDDDDDYGDGNDDEEENSQEHLLSPPHGVLRSRTMLAGSSQISAEDSSDKRDEDATDCLSDRTAVLNEQRDDTMYVPECTPDGRYKKVQCYKSAGYCWCVHEDTGKNIPGTSVQNSLPNCDQLSAPRPMQGCPEPKKTAFLKELMGFLHTRMIDGTNDTNITGSEGGGTWKASPEEKAATWNFVVLDKNKNKVLERKEWKAFRSWVSAHRPLRRCGKKMPRYCDVNHDRKISMTEWLDCLNTKRNVTEAVSQISAVVPRRRGPNPFESILKDD